MYLHKVNYFNFPSSGRKNGYIEITVLSTYPDVCVTQKDAVNEILSQCLYLILTKLLTVTCLDKNINKIP